MLLTMLNLRTFTILLLHVLSADTTTTPATPHHHPKNVLKDKADQLYNFEHIQEHYDGTVQLSKEDMSQQELAFHFFQQHDLDKDTRLDGLEMLSAFRHVLPYQEYYEEDEPEYHLPQEQKEFLYYEEIVDDLLALDDDDKDGYLNYMEFSDALEDTLDMHPAAGY